MNASFNLPFTLAGQPFSYSFRYQRQLSNTPLTPQEQFAIGNRWTVRGFDGERTLNASNGWYIRNDLAWRTPLPEQELYLGMDYGEVGGAGSEYLVGRHLAGGVVGLRGQLFSTDYDVFIGRPFSKPTGFMTSDVTAGFNLFRDFLESFMRNGKYDVLSPLYSGEPVNEAEVLGAAVWLWMHSPLHRDAPLHTLPDLLLPVIKHRQYVVATEQGRPVFFM